MKKMIPEKCDVLIIGGGPGGAMTASMLAQKNIDVVVLEKEVFPREVVGESLIPHFWKYTDRMGATDEIMAAGFIPKSGGCTYWNEKFRKVAFSTFGYERPGLHVERDVFDNILLNKAKEQGAKVFHQVRATKIINNDEGAEVKYNLQDDDEEYTVKARYVVDATGQNALLAKQENIREFDEGFRFHSFWGYYEGGSYLDSNTVIRPMGEHKVHSPLTVVSTIGDWGWAWQIVMQEKTSVGIIVPRDSMKAFKERGTTMEERFQATINETPIVGRLMEDAILIPDSVKSIKDYAYKPTELVIGNTFLIGDAAAFVDPINSAGVIMALYGGFTAAWSIARSLGNPSRDVLFKQMFKEQLRLRLDLFRLLAYPSNLVTSEMSEKGIKIMNQLDKSEKDLAMTQIHLTHRADNLSDIIDYSSEHYCEEIPVEQIFGERV